MRETGDKQVVVPSQSSEDFGPEQKIRRLNIKHLLRRGVMVSAAAGCGEDSQSGEDSECAGAGAQTSI